ncbi:MAG: hypothetical protein AAF641_05645 [Pseudomonadota bacterium]
MGVKRDAGLNLSGIKITRVVIGSHFCAMALGLPVGFDPFFLLHAAIPGEMGQTIGAAAMFTLGIAFIFGVKLRGVSLMLAGYMIFSANLTLLIEGEASAIGPLWQSIALGAATMLCYTAMRPHEVHKTALVPVRTTRGAVAREIKNGVSPRRVVPKEGSPKAVRPDPFARTFAPLIAPTERMIGVAKTGKIAPKRVAEREELLDEDVPNIFANL